MGASMLWLFGQTGTQRVKDRGGPEFQVGVPFDQIQSVKTQDAQLGVLIYLLSVSIWQMHSYSFQ